MKNRYLTKQSTTLEYIEIYQEDNEGIYCYFQFRSILRHFKYKIDKNIWKTVLEPIISLNEGLNIGKTIGSYILTKKIIEETSFTEIMKNFK